MPFPSRLAALWRNLFRRPRVEQDLDRELHSYLDHLADEKVSSGLTPLEARRAARLELGGLDQVKEEVRQVRTGRLLHDLLQDLRYGARSLRKNPAFTGVAILALALGIGANTAMFSVAYGILWRPLPYPGAGRVAVVNLRFFPRDNPYGTLCFRDYLMWRQDNRAFETPSLFRGLRMDIGGGGAAPEQVQGATVTAGYFPALQVQPILGRIFAPSEEQPAAGSLAVLSESLWRRRFAASPDILGQAILVNGAPATVIGVMPAAFQLPRRDTEAWTNLRLVPPTRYGPWFYRGLARLKPGVTLEQAQAEVNRIGLRMMEQNPDYKRLTVPLLPLRDAIVGITLRPAILMLAGAVGLVLLIAVVNVANLMLARATVREREMALRLSLGAGRGRLVRQLLTESVLLASAGAAAGLALAWGGIALIRAWNPGNLPLADSIRLDGAAFGFMLLAAVLTGILFGLAPALQSARTDLNASIKEGGRAGASSRARGRFRAALVVAEIALSLMLLVGAGLLLRSVANLQDVTGGFSAPPDRILTMLISPGARNFRDPAAGQAYYQEVLRRARETPGVRSAALSDSLPPDRQSDADTFAIEGQPLAPGELNPIVTDATVSPGFFESLQIPLLQGRYFTEFDNASAAPVTIVSEGFARRFFPGQSAIGRRIRQSGPGSGSPWMTIAGVVGNVKYLGLTLDTDAAYYMPFAQSFQPRMFLVVHTAGPVPDLRSRIQAVDPGSTLAQMGTMREAFAGAISQPRFDALLLATFAAIALLLAAVGIYGLISYSVAQRTHEIGVRVALGAGRGRVAAMLIRQAGALAAIGLGAGLAGALALTRLLRTMLFGVGVTDIPTFAAAALALAVVVLLAIAIPARRAMRVSPVVALRYE